jgi:signal peptidase I
MADIEARDPPISEPDTTTAADRDPSERTAADRKEAEPNAQDRKSHGFFGSTPFLVLVALAIAILVKTFLIQAFYIPSASMEPTLEIGDRVFVNKLAYDIGDLARGDVIVFANPHPEQLQERGAVGAFLHWLGEGIGFAQPADEDFIKRVIGLPGETIEIRDNVVYIDGEPLDEPYLTDAARRSNGDFPETRIPPDQLFMMGDNRGNSADSRYGLGLVPVDKVIGRAFIVIWPPSQFGGV